MSEQGNVVGQGRDLWSDDYDCSSFVERIYDARRNDAHNKMLSEDDVIEAIRLYGRREFRRGLERGLSVAELAVAYLTEEPDTERQRRHREWIRAAIQRAREEADRNGY